MCYFLACSRVFYLHTVFTYLFVAHLNFFVFFIRLNFQFCPSSKVHGFSSVDLKSNGEDEVCHLFSRHASLQ